MADAVIAAAFKTSKDRLGVSCGGCATSKFAGAAKDWHKPCSRPSRKCWGDRGGILAGKAITVRLRHAYGGIEVRDPAVSPGMAVK
jgi:hypothetical protein